MEERKEPIEMIVQGSPEEVQYDFTPTSFSEYIGQEELKSKLEIYIKACKMRNEALDHMILFGPPGLGKTTLCQIMSQRMGVNIKICSGPMMERTGDLVAILSSLQKHDILFIDEIHRTPTNVEEVLYSAMEQFKVDIIVGKGPGAKTITLPIQPFTLIGATTKIGAISAPLRSRFGITEHIKFYTVPEITQVILQNAKYLEVELDADAAEELAKRARGTPRIAKKMLRRVRDFAQVNHKNKANLAVVISTMDALGIDEHGFTTIDQLLLRKLVLDYAGGPVSLNTLSSISGEDPDTIETVYEPYLIRQGFLEKTSRGRQITQNKLPYLKKKFLGQLSIIESQET
jgi:Holliday junction DNA helicase RuvB